MRCRNGWRGEILWYFTRSLLRSPYLWSTQDPSLLVSVSRVEYAPLERSVFDRFTPRETRLGQVAACRCRTSRVPDIEPLVCSTVPLAVPMRAPREVELLLCSRPLPNRCLIGCSPWPLRLWMIKVIRHVTVFTVSLLGAVGSVPRDASGDPPRMGRVCALGISAVMNSAARFQRLFAPGPGLLVSVSRVELSPLWTGCRSLAPPTAVSLPRQFNRSVFRFGHAGGCKCG